jgi:hypothetical protein
MRDAVRALAPVMLCKRLRVTLIEPNASVSVEGTNTIKFRGFPVLIDVRNVDTVGGNHVDSVTISGAALITPDPNKILFVTLLPNGVPPDSFELALTAGNSHSGVTFTIDRSGNVKSTSSSARVQAVKIPALQVLVGAHAPCALPAV